MVNYTEKEYMDMIIVNAGGNAARIKSMYFRKYFPPDNSVWKRNYYLKSILG